MTSRKKNVTGSIQPKFMYQFTSPDYYKPVEHWEVDKNTNVDVFEEIEENHPRSFQYVEAQVNALDEISQSYLHQGNTKLDQPRYVAETRVHESTDLKMIKLISKACAFYEEGHVVMDCPFFVFSH